MIYFCYREVKIPIYSIPFLILKKFQAPWIFSILDEDGDVHCGGSVISKTLLLTAGHCLRPGLDLSKFKLVFGEKNPENTDTSSIVKQFTRNNVKFHPDYTVSISFKEITFHISAILSP